MTRIKKHTTNSTVGLLLVAWLSLAPTHASDAPMSPRARALADDLRKVPTHTVERIDRANLPGSPRGKAAEVRTSAGTTADRIDRSVPVGSPRGRETFPGLGWSNR